ncbi:MAG: carboxypeptidase [Microcystis aeruginosa Ma_QC_Ch_20071001_S25D]|jgi:predicted chitinase|uniref:Carboxypeptidase n=1 Tax=Microcystis aeruginosa Ma_QC_Ch_20071001_S25D TaxID=2486250 RepID=A0A552FJ37_MICAE|nr:MAG: carboxypeptidase [Microcystis aeruginosa Ma_QC_Ch_20071001_S25D]TRU57916.1 MAG: carboxypeptidase [Microcystis aeruginosa Ma_QC_Ch_20071001_M135]
MKLEQLATIKDPTPIDQLDEAQLKELQNALFRLGYPVRTIDGLIGPRTRTAWAEFKTDIFQGNPNLIGPGSIATLQKKMDEIGKGKVHNFSTKQGTIEAIKSECKTQGIGLKTQIAYVLATTQWETAQTFQPVREAFWLNEDWRRRNLRYHPYYGRGYVQLTWKTNYQKYGGILGIDLVNKPDLAMNQNVALFVLVHGFKTGAFTGRKITDYINNHQTDFLNARRCINGTNKMLQIANLAKKFLTIL